MKKIVASVLLSIASLSFMSACDYDQFQRRDVTHDPNCTCTCSCCEAARGHTTKDVDDIIDDLIDQLDIDDLSRQTVKTTINVACESLEFQTFFTKYYPGIVKYNGYSAILDDGTAVYFVYRPGNDPNVKDYDYDHYDEETQLYYEALNYCVENDIIDFIATEYSNYTFKYLTSNKLLRLNDYSELDLSQQSIYSKEMCTNEDGDIVGSIWCTPTPTV